MKVYIEPEHIDEYIDKRITQQLKEVNSCVNEINLHNKSITENKEDFYKEIMETIEKVQKAINKYRRNEQDGILVGSNGQLLQIYGNATIHDWVVWYIKNYKKGKL